MRLNSTLGPDATATPSRLLPKLPFQGRTSWTVKDRLRSCHFVEFLTLNRAYQRDLPTSVQYRAARPCGASYLMIAAQS